MTRPASCWVRAYLFKGCEDAKWRTEKNEYKDVLFFSLPVHLYVSKQQIRNRTDSPPLLSSLILSSSLFSSLLISSPIFFSPPLFSSPIFYSPLRSSPMRDPFHLVLRTGNIKPNFQISDSSSKSNQSPQSTFVCSESLISNSVQIFRSSHKPVQIKNATERSLNATSENGKRVSPEMTRL